MDGGADGSSYTEYLLPGLPAPLDAIFNATGSAPGALFCADQVLMADGRVLTPGGTHWYPEPSAPGTGLGVAELEGLHDTRIYDPATNIWSQSGRMNFGRWYPSLVTLPDGKVFVASGVTKLLKPLYPNHPLDSGTNVRQTETYDPHTGVWSDNGTGAARSLPLYPRLHLLPDGKIYYDGGGQTFNPMGEAYDELTWNLTAVYDPAARTWKSLTIPVQVTVNTPSHVPAITAGFRGSSFSLMLPLNPPYTRGVVPVRRRRPRYDAGRVLRDRGIDDQHDRHRGGRHIHLRGDRAPQQRPVVLDRGGAAHRPGDGVLRRQP